MAYSVARANQSFMNLINRRDLNTNGWPFKTHGGTRAGPNPNALGGNVTSRKEWPRAGRACVLMQALPEAVPIISPDAYQLPKAPAMTPQTYQGRADAAPLQQLQPAQQRIAQPQAAAMQQHHISLPAWTPPGTPVQRRQVGPQVGPASGWTPLTFSRPQPGMGPVSRRSRGPIQWVNVPSKRAGGMGDWEGKDYLIAALSGLAALPVITQIVSAMRQR
jgi:hypothetical protein